ncbi:tetratricopeptide repeat protein [Microcoleus anatoxicus]|uniref:Tetratricopeptide repeat protein n=1 Tax=Microcoleus anatoxicus PTRS2 TaxID=2705321 RepID=A0ABU8YVE3_9CYAN
MNFSNKIPIALIGTIATIVIAQPTAVFAISADAVGKIAKSITVLIDSKNPGSGIIIKRNGNTYTVLTARHVFKDAQAKYEIVTPDDKRYLLNYSSVKKLPNIDLAVVEFTSSQTYSVAKIGNSDLATEGKAAYVAGFPKTSAAINTSIYNFTDGRITANASKPINDDGYSLVYSNNTLPGMSGGPVLNESGEVVGIHGRADTRAAESSSINQNIQIAKTGFNLGIPINTSLRLLASSQVDLGVKVPSAPVATGPKADDFFIQGEDKYKKGDYQGAVADYNQALRINPNYAEAYFSRGLARSDLGDKQGAIADYNEALRINPNDVIAYYNRGVARYKLGDKQGAIADYDQALRIDSNNASFYLNRGTARSDLGDKQGAIADYDQALRIDPNNAKAYNNRGTARDELGDKRGALADYDQALRIDPNYASPYNNRGVIRASLGNQQGAIQDYQKAADLYQQQGDTDKYKIALDNLRGSQRTATNSQRSSALLTANRSLIPGRSSALPSDGSLYEQHTFVGRAGQSVTITLESSDFDTFVALFSRDGKKLAENDDISRSNTNSALTFTLPASGRYVVVVNAYKKGERGRYTLTIR